MKIYLILSIIFLIGFSVVQLPLGYSANNKNNSFSYYEKNCDRDACVVTTCKDVKTCHTSGPRGSVDNDNSSPQTNQNTLDSKVDDLMKKWKNFLNFEN